MAAVEVSVLVFGSGFWSTPAEIFCSAEASASGSPVSSLPSSSASYSRVREIAIWMSEAAIGASTAESTMPMSPGSPAPLSRSRFELDELPMYIIEYPR